jgi:hypothetical protein
MSDFKLDRAALEETLAIMAAERNDEIVDYARRKNAGVGTSLKGTDDIAAHLVYDDKMLAEVTKDCAFNDPRMHIDSSFKSIKDWQVKSGESFREIREDMHLTRAVLDELADIAHLQKVQSELCGNLMAESQARAADKCILFVNVTNEDLREAGKRIVKCSRRWMDGHGDVEPVDLTGAFEGTEPLPEDELTPAEVSGALGL